MDISTIQKLTAITVTRRNVNHVNDYLIPNIQPKHIYLPNNRTKAVVGDILINTKIKIVVPTPEGELVQIVRVRWIMGKGQFKRRFDKTRLNGPRGVFRVIEKTPSTS